MIDIFKEQLRREHPETAQKVFDALDQPAPVSLRLNPLKFRNGEHTLPSAADGRVNWEPNAVYLRERPVFTLDPLFHAGAYYVQESSSMWLGETVRRLREAGRLAGGPLKVLDLCAAPGGKSTHLASVLNEGDLLITNEIHRTRAQVLTENMTKWGHPNVVITGNDPKHFQALGSWFDVVVVDAPCSGEGLFRRDKDAIGHWSPDAVQSCSLRQHQILDDIWPVLKPGGVLIYSTCTFNRSENDAQISRLIATYGAEGVSIGALTASQASVASPAASPPVASSVSPAPPASAPLATSSIAASTASAPSASTASSASITQNLIEEVHPDGAVIYRCLPGITRGEGYTFSVLKKPNNAEIHYGNARGAGKFRKDPRAQVLQAIESADDYEAMTNDKQVFAVHRRFLRDITQVADSLYIHHMGIELGDERRLGQSLAMSVVRKPGYFTEYAMNQEQAVQYLKRESIAIDSHMSGFVLLSYLGLGLGFGKATRGRVNNHYPQEWRIRMR